MNAAQKKALASIVSDLDACKVSLEALYGEMQDNWDEKSEKWQDGDNGVAESDRIAVLTDAADTVHNVITDLESNAETD